MSSRRRFFAPFTDETLKRCGRCGELRPLGVFIRDAGKRVGYGSICRACDREKSAAYYAAHREEVLARAEAKRLAERPELRDRMCGECGEPL